MSSEVDPRGIEAARKAIRYLSHPETPWSDEQVAGVIQAYLSASPSIGRVGVKPLEWEFVSASIFDALSPVSGVYRVRLQDGDWTVSLSGSVLGWFETERGAKDFANRHHEARIRSALVSHEEPAGDTQGVGAGVTDAMTDAAEAVLEQWGMTHGKRTAARLAVQAALSAALVSPPDNGEAAAAIRYVTLGLGEWLSGTYLREDNLPSICFGPAPEAKSPGEVPTREVAEWATGNGAVVISFANLKAAERMLDLVKEAIDLKSAALQSHNEGSAGE